MKRCGFFFASLFVVMTTMTEAFVVNLAPSSKRLLKAMYMVEKVEVCTNKDCKARGGGPRLEKLVGTILEEKGLQAQITLETCGCQDECGYGPNMVVDGKIVNNVRGREAVLQALGIEGEEE